MVNSVSAGASDTDDPVDDVIERCLNPDSPTSFFLYAGAGSGKTYSLKKGLEAFKSKHGTKFRKTGKKVAVITYTNAACDEIIERVEDDPLFHISTIHSFCWLQIKNFHNDIRSWLRTAIPEKILKEEQNEARGRPGTQASMIRQRKISAYRERLRWLDVYREFTYSPDGDNLGKASLSHAEVIGICSDFLVSKPSFQQILINRYPFLLIDESQDTNKNLVEAFFTVEDQQQGCFGLGLIGDTMQRIYGDGKQNLGEDLPDRWEKPIKQMNRRSPSRIVALANDIRSESDQQEQKFLEGSPEGYVRLVIAPANKTKKPEFEHSFRKLMSEVSDDNLWENPQEVKHLMLEHKMAAARMGFLDMYSALASSKSLLTALRAGDLPAVRLFSEYVLPLYELEKSGSKHGVITHLRRAKSPLLDPHFLKTITTGNPLNPLKNAIQAVFDLIDSGSNISFIRVLRCVAEHRLFVIPQSLTLFIDETDNTTPDETSEITGVESHSWEAIRSFLGTRFNQIYEYKKYVTGDGVFDTHQGVKGREFDRVLVIMDDDEAGGFLFSYEKMFGVRPLTQNDQNRLRDGEETGVERTRRLFYVICTRAEKSLGLVVYSQDPELLKQKVLEKEWFTESEVIVFN